MNVTKWGVDVPGNKVTVGLTTADPAIEAKISDLLGAAYVAFVRTETFFRASWMILIVRPGTAATLTFVRSRFHISIQHDRFSFRDLQFYRWTLRKRNFPTERPRLWRYGCYFVLQQWTDGRRTHFHLPSKRLWVRICWGEYICRGFLPLIITNSVESEASVGMVCY